MSKINFMDGTLSGKLERVVGVKRNDQRFVRGYVKPHDPQSASQLARRARVKEVAIFGKGFLTPALNHPSMKKPYQQTAHNRLMIDNQLHINGTIRPKQNWQMHAGPLWFSNYFDVQPEPAPTRIELFWTDNPFGEAESTDYCMGAAYNDTKDLYFCSAVHPRSAGYIALTDIGTPGDKCYVYLWFWKPNGIFSLTGGSWKNLV